MNTQQKQNEIKKKGVVVNPSRDIDYSDREQDFSGEFGEQIDDDTHEEVNPSKLDRKEVKLGRGGVEIEKSKRDADRVKGNKQQGTQKTKTQ